MELVEVSNLNHDDDFLFAIAVGKPFDNQTHCAILYHWEGQIRALDFINQKVRSSHTIGDFGYEGYLYVKYNQDSIVDAFAMQVPAICELVKEKNDGIFYGINFSESKFDSEGNLIFATGEFGLTCATFVMAVLERSLGVQLIDETTWETRDEDAEWQNAILELLKNKNISDPNYYPDELISQYEKNIGCFRYKPEEVGAATSSDAIPASYDYCEEKGRQLIEALEYGIDTFNKMYS
ncbi:MAG: hypothetical protein ACNS60_20395 [Candidatus Cyclobacteriaceae bacterium M2_1C_046]